MCQNCPKCQKDPLAGIKFVKWCYKCKKHYDRTKGIGKIMMDAYDKAGLNLNE